MFVSKKTTRKQHVSLSLLLKEAIQSKDEAKKIAFYEACYEQLFNPIYLICKYYFPFEADSMAQDAFFKIMKLPLKKLVPYINYLEKALMVIAKNHCLTKLKQKRSTLEINEAHYNYNTTSPHTNSDLKYDRTYLISILSSKQKTAIERTMQGYSQKEIAEEMDSSVGAVKNLVLRGRLKIKRFLIEEAKSIAKS